MTAIFLQVFRQLIRTDATLLVARQRVINELRIRQIEVCHDFPELLRRALLSKSRVALLFLGNAGDAPILVVMGGINQRIVRQCEQFFMDAFIQSIGIAVLKVGAAAAFDQQRIPGEDPVAEQVSEMSGGMSRRMEWLQLNTAHLKRHALFEANIGTGQAVESRHGYLATDLVFQFACGGNVVCMDMGVHAVGQRQSEPANCGQVTLHRNDYRINQNRPPGFLAAQQVRVGTRQGFKQLAKDHGDSRCVIPHIRYIAVYTIYNYNVCKRIGDRNRVMTIALKKKLDMRAMRLASTQASGLLKTLANPDRLLLLCQLSHGEQCVSELENLLGIVQPTLSQQLGVLREERLVTTRREGKQIFYGIASKEALAVLQVLYQQFCAPDKGK